MSCMRRRPMRPPPPPSPRPPPPGRSPTARTSKPSDFGILPLQTTRTSFAWFFCARGVTIFRIRRGSRAGPARLGQPVQSLLRQIKHIRQLERPLGETAGEITVLVADVGDDRVAFG